LHASEWSVHSICRPSPAHQFTVPAKHGLRLDQQTGPRRPRQSIAESSQNHPIARRPADLLDLALEDLNLSAERQHLSLQLGLIAMVVVITSRRTCTSEYSIEANMTATDLTRLSRRSSGGWQLGVAAWSSNPTEFLNPTPQNLGCQAHLESDSFTHIPHVEDASNSARARCHDYNSIPKQHCLLNTVGHKDDRLLVRALRR
jgi:hypothetical protein